MKLALDVSRCLSKRTRNRGERHSGSQDIHNLFLHSLYYLVLILKKTLMSVCACAYVCENYICKCD